MNKGDELSADAAGDPKWTNRRVAQRRLELAVAEGQAELAAKLRAELASYTPAPPSTERFESATYQHGTLLPTSISNHRWTGLRFEWLNWPTALFIAGVAWLAFLLVYLA